MKRKVIQSGQSLIEIVFALAIFTIGVVTVGYLMIESMSAMNSITNYQQARLLASDGIGAVRSIRDGNYNLLEAGTYSLYFEQGRWVLDTMSAEESKFTREIIISDVDEDNKEVYSVVSWTTYGKDRSVTRVARLSNWRQNQGDAGDLDIAMDSAAVFASSTTLSNIYLKNKGSEDIVLTQMSVEWAASSTLNRIVIQGLEVFNATSSIPASSGDDIDISDYHLTAFSGYHSIDEVVFDGDVSGTNFVIRFTFEDDSTRSVYITL